MSPITGDRLWRVYADVRRIVGRNGSAAAASPASAGVDRSDEAAWTEQLAAGHADYRAACPPATGDVAVVCVSSRPHHLADVVAGVGRQTNTVAEFVLVTNSPEYQGVDVVDATGRLEDRVRRVEIIRSDPDRSLGSCLNEAMGRTGSRFVAKFDDDDHYGAEYLTDALRAHGYAGAAVVGKHSYYAHLVGDDRTVLRFPANEFRYSSTLAGGTLVIDRERTGDLEFPDLSLGEDRGFLAACHRRGLSTFSADRFNFVQRRADDNTWAVASEDFLRNTVPVASGCPLDQIDC